MTLLSVKIIGIFLNIESNSFASITQQGAQLPNEGPATQCNNESSNRAMRCVSESMKMKQNFRCAHMAYALSLPSTLLLNRQYRRYTLQDMCMTPQRLAKICHIEFA